MNIDNSFDLSVICDGASKRCRSGGQPVPLRVDALSQAEWSYLRGLFLTDGCSDLSKKQGRYRVRFLLQGNEGELASRVAELLSRAGLNPRIYTDRRKNVLTVEAYSMHLFNFLPGKDALNRSEELREKFFRENALFTVEGGAPFLAGLLDGDGYCSVEVGKRYFFREVIVSTWCFQQDNDLYLVDYVRRFVESLAPSSVRIKKRRGRKTLAACIRRSGIMALLDARIAHHSWKVVRWLELIAEARSERSRFISVRQVAGLLHIPYRAVARWVSSGIVRFVQGGRWRYIPAAEVERLKTKLAKSGGC